MTLNKIKEARQKMGISQKDMAKMLGVSPSTLSEYEKGAHEPKSDILSQIADICNVSVDYLLCRDDKTKNPPAPARPEQGGRRNEVDLVRLYEGLVQIGWVKEGQDLTDDDLDFLLAIGNIIKAWFGKGE